LFTQTNDKTFDVEQHSREAEATRAKQMRPIALFLPTVKSLTINNKQQAFNRQLTENKFERQATWCKLACLRAYSKSLARMSECCAPAATPTTRRGTVVSCIERIQ